MESLLSTLTAILIVLQIIALVDDMGKRDNDKPPEKKQEPTKEE